MMLSGFPLNTFISKERVWEVKYFVSYVKWHTDRTSSDGGTEVVRVTARGPCCVRVTRAVLRLCVVWVCGLQLTGRRRRRDGRALCVCMCMCVCMCVCAHVFTLSRVRSRLSVAMAWLESSAFRHSAAPVWKINTHCHHSDMAHLRIILSMYTCRTWETFRFEGLRPVCDSWNYSCVWMSLFFLVGLDIDTIP